MDQGKELMSWESEAAFRTLFEFATIGIVVVDQSGEIVMLNPNAEKLFGYTSGEVIGETVEFLIPERFRKRHSAHRDRYDSNPSPREMGLGLELYGLRKGGEEFPLEISLSNYELAGQNMTVAFVTDISERKRLEEREKNYLEELEFRVKERTQQLTESLDREHELNEFKSRFVAMASHEFRIPLSTILTSSSLIEKYDRAEQFDKRQKHIERVKSSVKMMNDMLVDFLSLEKIENNTLKAVPERFMLQDLMNEVQEGVECDLRKGQNLIIESPEQAEMTIDPKLLKYILVNLIANAAKYSPENSSIRISCSVNADQIDLSVADQGIGIPRDEQDEIFTLFYRASNARSEKGSGLGLNLVKKYVELMKGKIWFVSEYGKGTIFHVQIPQKAI
jgi:PAS domain S-box-containing protein